MEDGERANWRGREEKRTHSFDSGPDTVVFDASAYIGDLYSIARNNLSENKLGARDDKFVVLSGGVSQSSYFSTCFLLAFQPRTTD